MSPLRVYKPLIICFSSAPPGVDRQGRVGEEPLVVRTLRRRMAPRKEHEDRRSLRDQ